VAKAIGDLLSSNIVIDGVDISGHLFSLPGQAAELIANGLQQNTYLQELNVDGCGFSGEWFDALKWLVNSRTRSVDKCNGAGSFNEVTLSCDCSAHELLGFGPTCSGCNGHGRLSSSTTSCQCDEYYTRESDCSISDRKCEWNDIIKDSDNGTWVVPAECILVSTSGRSVETTEAVALCNALTGHPSVQTVNLNGGQIGDDGAAAAGRLLAANNIITNMLLSHNNITSAGADMLAARLVNNTGLVHLELNNNGALGDSGAASITTALLGHPNLKILSLARTNLGDEGVEAVALLIVANSPTISSVGVRMNLITVTGARILGGAIRQSTGLASLDVSGNQIGDTGMIYIANALHHHPTLHTLRANATNMYDSGASAFGELLSTNSALQWLHLQNNYISDVGASNLARGYKRNSRLLHLDVSDNQVGDAWLDAIDWLQSTGDFRDQSVASCSGAGIVSKGVDGTVTCDCYGAILGLGPTCSDCNGHGSLHGPNRRSCVCDSLYAAARDCSVLKPREFTTVATTTVQHISLGRKRSRGQAGTAIGATLGLVVIGVAVLFLKRYRVSRTSDANELEVAHQQHVASSTDLVEGAALLSQLRSGAGRVSVADARLANKFVAVARERAEARFVIEYRQLVSAKSMDAFRHEFSQFEQRRSEVTVGAELGRGQSGVVFIGSVAAGGNEPFDVAIKTRIDAGNTVGGGVAVTADEALLLEALLLNGLRHVGIIKLLAVVTLSAPIMICTELMPNGDLRQFLRSQRLKVVGECDDMLPTSYQSLHADTVDATQMLAMAATLSSAMAFLEKNSIIHRDIAARNVLVGREATDVKIADLGAARNVHRTNEASYQGVYTATTDHNPARWMPLEAMREAKFSHKSDVFSFGVLLWEILSLGQTPWGAFAVRDFVDALERGDRLQFPTALDQQQQQQHRRPGSDASDGRDHTRPSSPSSGLCRTMYSVACRCWAVRPEKRPHFHQLEGEFSVHRTVLVAETQLRGRVVWEDNEGVACSVPKSPQAGRPMLDADGYVEDAATAVGHKSASQDGNANSRDIAASKLDSGGYVEDTFADTSITATTRVASVEASGPILDVDGYVHELHPVPVVEQPNSIESCDHCSGLHPDETRL
jgi:serine/threonine protein kinase/Ran GTPase-activating protein (RanGAP) involved in mRNA processing and transport